MERDRDDAAADEERRDDDLEAAVDLDLDRDRRCCDFEDDRDAADDRDDEREPPRRRFFTPLSLTVEGVDLLLFSTVFVSFFDFLLPLADDEPRLVVPFVRAGELDRDRDRLSLMFAPTRFCDGLVKLLFLSSLVSTFIFFFSSS